MFFYISFLFKFLKKMKTYMHLTLYKDVDKVFVKHTFVRSSVLSKGIGNKSTIKWWKMLIFTSPPISHCSTWRLFCIFSNQITRKVIMENRNSYFYHVEYLALGIFFSKKSQKLTFFKKFIIFALLSNWSLMLITDTNWLRIQIPSPIYQKL